MYSLTNISGQKVLNHVDRASIGKWTEDRIDFDIQTKAALSTPALAIDYFNQIAASAGVNIGTLDATATNQINAALLWYIAGQYKDLDLMNIPKESCTEDDYRLRANYYGQSCTFLKMVSTQMAALADFCSFKADILDPDLFGTSTYYKCGNEIHSAS